MVTRLRGGGTRRYYQQFGSSTDTDEESSNILLSSAQTETNEEQELAIHPEALALPPTEVPLTRPNITQNLVSEHEMMEAPPDEQETQQPASETGTSLLGTSAPLLANPSLTDVLSNFSIWPQTHQPITPNAHTTYPMSSQNAKTSFIGAPGHVSSTTTQRERKPGDNPQQALPPVKTNQCKVVAEVYVKGDVPEVVHRRRLLILPNKLHHQRLILRSLTLALTFRLTRSHLPHLLTYDTGYDVIEPYAILVEPVDCVIVLPTF